MSQENYNNLQELANSLKEEEINLAKKHLVAFESYRTKTPSQMLRLFKLILKTPDIQLDKAKRSVSPDNTLKSFNQLVKRTLDRVLESLILDINISRGDLYSPVFQYRFKIRKLIMQASILQGRGLSSFSLKNFNWIIKTAKKYELYDELIETLYLKQAVVFNRDGQKAYDKIAEEIDYYESCRNLLRKSKDLYRSFYARASFQANTKKLVSELESSLAKLEEDNKELKSANVSLYIYPLKMESATLKKDFDAGLDIGLRFIELLKTNPSIYSKIRIGIYYSNLADNEISAFRFSSSQRFSNYAIDYLRDRMTINNVIAIELNALGFFFDAKYQDSLKSIDSIMNEPIIDRYKLHKTKLFYYKAMSYFALEDYKKAYLLLNNLPDLEKDKEGWNVWIRIMRIICSIEQEKINLIDYDLESFRKYIQRVEKKSEIIERDKIILKLLIELEKNDFDYIYMQDIKSFNKDLDKIQSVSGEYLWKPNSPELIIFDIWLKAKISNNSYLNEYEKFKKNLTPQNKNVLIVPSNDVNSKQSQSQLSIEF
ncbi:MAG: hypothetical protein CMP59_06640 [Flavobacteriales bacterium]|nr:hypothetical protein [Flavobacteriales bacterium]|tara:strand:+ start:279 stop:1904 length:1626 start_codon:yes stop_codon:yes gene_type:complete